MLSNERASIVMMLKCPNCGRLHFKTERMYVVDIKRRWQELVYQKDLINNSSFNLCCDVPLEYYLGNELARNVLFGKGVINERN